MKVGDLVRFRYSDQHPPIIGILLEHKVVDVTQPRMRVRFEPLCTVRILENNGTTNSWDVWNTDNLEVINETG